MFRKNIELRATIKNSGIPHYYVAERLGVSEITFSRWLRVELSNEKKQQVLNVIDEIKQEQINTAL